jgi:chromosome segregation ATPase
MSDKNENEKPLTSSDLREHLGSTLIQFYNDLVEPNFRKLLSSQVVDFYQKVIKLDFQKTIKEEITNMQNEMNQRLDDLYKKFETYFQEYWVIKEQMKRKDTTEEVLLKDVTELKSKVTHLQQQIEEFERRLNAH